MNNKASDHRRAVDTLNFFEPWLARPIDPDFYPEKTDVEILITEALTLGSPRLCEGLMRCLEEVALFYGKTWEHFFEISSGESRQRCGMMLEYMGYGPFPSQHYDTWLGWSGVRSSFLKRPKTDLELKWKVAEPRFGLKRRLIDKIDLPWTEGGIHHLIPDVNVVLDFETHEVIGLTYKGAEVIQKWRQEQGYAEVLIFQQRCASDSGE